jgi:RNA polymerase sigma-70 factor (ECF subfamily)
VPDGAGEILAVAAVFLVDWRRFADVPDDARPWLFAVARKTIANQNRGLRRGPEPSQILPTYAHGGHNSSRSAAVAAPVSHRAARASRQDRSLGVGRTDAATRVTNVNSIAALSP